MIGTLTALKFLTIIVQNIKRNNMIRQLSRLAEVTTILEYANINEEVDEMLHRFYVQLKEKAEKENVKLCKTCIDYENETREN